MAKTVTNVVLQGDLLTIQYTDSDDPSVDEKAAIIRWKRHPKIIRLVQGFFGIVGTYFLTPNKSLDAMGDADLDALLRRLLQEDGHNPNPGG